MSDLYLVSPNNPANAQDLNQLVAQIDGQNDAAFVSYQPLAAPTAPTAAVSSTSGVLNGAYAYCCVFVTGNVDGFGTIHASGHQTAAGTASTTVNPANQEVTLSDIPLGPTGVVTRDLYRTKAGGSVFYYLDSLDDNVTTDYVDNASDSLLGTTIAPTVNTTGSPPQLPVYAGVPGYTAPVGSLVGVYPSGGVLLIYQSTGSSWAPLAPAATAALLGTVQLAANPASGNPLVPSITTSALETALTTTTATTLATYTSSSVGAYTIHLFWRIITAATTITLTVSYTDAGNTAHTDTLVNAVNQAVGEYWQDMEIVSAASAAITVSMTARTASQVYASAIVEGN